MFVSYLSLFGVLRPKNAKVYVADGIREMLPCGSRCMVVEVLCCIVACGF